jgi:hypothetical protein
MRNVANAPGSTPPGKSWNQRPYRTPAAGKAGGGNALELMYAGNHPHCVAHRARITRENKEAASCSNFHLDADTVSF